MNFCCGIPLDLKKNMKNEPVLSFKPQKKGFVGPLRMKETWVPMVYQYIYNPRHPVTPVWVGGI